MRKHMLSSLVLTGSLLACATAQALNVQVAADWRSSHPGVNRDSAADMIVMHLVEGLVAYDERGQVKPLLAESVEQSADGLSYVFKLRDKVSFHNGEALTSADVLWTWSHYMDPKTNWRCRAEFDGRQGLKVVDVSASDPLTVTMKLDRPNPLFLSSLARPDCGMTGILHKDSVNPDGSWKSPIGTGPFKLGTWRRGTSIELLRFDGYANRGGEVDGYTGNKQPLVEHVRFIVVPDASAAKAALLRGDIDLIPDISSSDYAELKAQPNINISHSFTARRNAILIQTADPLLTAPLRRAIAAAIDSDALVSMVTSGLGKPNNSIIPEASPYSTPAMRTRWKYDVEEAKRLLREAGYRGQQITLNTNKDYPAMYDSAILAQAMLQQAGMSVKLEVLDWATQLDRYNAGKFQMMAFSYSPRFDEALLYEHFMGDKSVQTRKVWDSPDAQKLLDAALATNDPAIRQPLFEQLHKAFLNEVPMIMLYNGITIDASSNKVQGYKSWTGSAARLWQVEKK